MNYALFKSNQQTRNVKNNPQLIQPQSINHQGFCKINNTQPNQSAFHTSEWLKTVNVCGCFQYCTIFHAQTCDHQVHKCNDMYMYVKLGGSSTNHKLPALKRLPIWQAIINHKKASFWNVTRSFWCVQYKTYPRIRFNVTWLV